MDIWIINKHLKRLNFTSTRQIKTSMRYHYISIRTLKKKEKKDTEFKILWNDAVTLYQLTGDLVQF